jgi:tetratricopeptide (TPR) repeat protein
LFQKSYVRGAAGDFAGALGCLDQLSVAAQDGYVAQLRRGWLSYLGGKSELSVKAYQRAVELASEAIEPKIGLLTPLAALGRWREVVATADSVLAVDRANYTANIRLAFALYSLGDYPGAQSHYRALNAMYPSDVDAQTGLAWCLWRRGARAEAKVLFASVLAIAPANASAKEGMKVVGN